MKKNKYGKIVNVSSLGAVHPAVSVMHYHSAKAGVLGLTYNLAFELAPFNISVNAILPGWIDTDLTRQARKDLAGLNERVLARTPVGHWGEPDDLAGAAIFLASPASNFVTGVALPVDGGYSIML